MPKQRTYFCIDMKCFYASVECAERGLNPFETNLVVADLSRGSGTICLAISPKLKAQGVRNRCRLYEIPKTIEYEAAPPRMQLYIEYAADIYSIYLDYFAPEDIHVYSIDEAFIDATDYLKTYGTDAKALAKKLMDEIAQKLHIPSTAGIGTNLFLAKIALDITAKHSKEHMGYLDEETFKKTLWDHRPITDFWQISVGTAWGRESCLMEDIKSYQPKTRSLSSSQILPCDYGFAEARTVLSEMVLHGCQNMMRQGVICRSVWIGVGYSRDTLPSAHGQVRLMSATAVNSLKLSISFGNICDELCEGYDFFTDLEAVESEKAREKAVLGIMDKYGKNAVLRGINFMPGATQRERNGMIGGHRAGYDETGKG